MSANWLQEWWRTARPGRMAATAMLVLVILLLSIPPQWLLPSPPPALALQPLANSPMPRRDMARFTYDLRLGRSVPADMAVYFISTAPAMTVTLNGTAIFSRESSTRWLAAALPIPILRQIDGGMLHPGHNNITVEAYAYGLNNKYKLPIFFGKNKLIYNYYIYANILFKYITLMLVGPYFTFALISFFISIYTTQNRYWAVYAVVFAIAGIKGLASYYSDLPLNSAYDKITMISAAVQLSLMTIATDGFFNDKIKKTSIALTIFGFFLCSLIFVIYNPSYVLYLRNLWLLFIAACMLYNLVLLIEAAWRQRARAAMLLLVPMVMGLVVFAVEVFERLSGSGAGIGTGMTVGRGALLAVGAILVKRWVTTIKALDSSNSRFASELQHAQSHLRETLHTRHQREQQIMLQQERELMMRELHDGLGNQLVSGMALCAMNPDTTPEIEGVLRDAMSELRLILIAMNDFDGDLASAIASFLPQLQRQVRPFGIMLECDVADLPSLPSLRPAQMQQILRVVQESVMNAAKHSGSTVVRIEGSAHHPCVTVRDDGHGGAAERDGSFGLKIMRSRAINLGAELSIVSDGHGTIVTLCLDGACNPTDRS